MITYALYKGDKLLGFGTTKELADQLGVKEKTIKFYNTKSYKKRSKNGKNRRILIII